MEEKMLKNIRGFEILIRALGGLERLKTCWDIALHSNQRIKVFVCFSRFRFREKEFLKAMKRIFFGSRYANDFERLKKPKS